MNPTGGSDPRPIAAATSGASFEGIARRYFSDLWGKDLASGSVAVGGAVPKQFDFVSADGRFVGDARWYKNIRSPAAKWSTISEYVWLLQRVSADKTFIVFGHDPEVPERYLQRFRPLVGPVEFYFLNATGSSHRRL